MRFALVDNWKDILRHSWTIRLIVLAAVLSGCEVALPFLEGYLPVPPRTFAVLCFIVSAAAFPARLIVQAKLSGGRREAD